MFILKIQNYVCIRFTVTLACIHQTIRGEGFELSENLAVYFKTEIGPARTLTGDICLTLKSLNMCNNEMAFRILRNCHFRELIQCLVIS